MAQTQCLAYCVAFPDTHTCLALHDRIACVHEQTHVAAVKHAGVLSGEALAYLVTAQSTDSLGFSTVGWQPGSSVLKLPRRTLPVFVSLTRHLSDLAVPAPARQQAIYVVSLHCDTATKPCCNGS